MRLVGIAQRDATCQLRDSVLSACYESAASALRHKDSRGGTMWIENGFWPSPSTQTGQAVLPHPAFQFMVLMDWLRHSTQGFGRVARRVGAAVCTATPLSEPDWRVTHTALWMIAH